MDVELADDQLPANLRKLSRFIIHESSTFHGSTTR